MQEVDLHLSRELSGKTPPKNQKPGPNPKLLHFYPNFNPYL
jgi:hypothetical protein